MKGEEYYINGWHYINIYGSPSERGYAYGYFCAKEFCEIQKMLEYYIPETYGYSWNYFIHWICQSFQEMTKRRFPEIYQEMQGITKGCQANGCSTTIEEIIAWNFYLSLPYWFSFKSDSHVGKEGGAKDHCSAFIAVGDWTATGEIIVGHNSFTDYIDGQYSNVVLHIVPDTGHQIIMQTSPCWVWSGTDFFITSAGIIGTETTIGGFQPYEERNPIGYRIREAMQYANTLDDYVNMLIHENSGDYANSWLFGDIYTNEIMCLELGLKYHSISRTKNGFFIGFNATYDPRIRNLEVVNSGFYDIRRHQGARRVRLTELLIKNKGHLTCDVAKRILADHYDVYLKKVNPCSRTVCSHYDLDAREYMSQADRPKPFSPHGALDGVVCDSSLARKMEFWGRFGNSCGTAFDKDTFCRKHIQYSNFCPYLKDRPSQPWTLFSADTSQLVNKKNKKNYWKYPNTYIVTETAKSIQPYSTDILVQYLEPNPSFILKQIRRQTRRKSRKHKGK